MLERQEIIEWLGPFNWIGPRGQSFFVQPESSMAGVYLWTIQYNNSYLVYYVGETARCFRERIREHTKQYLSGAYNLYDPVEFARGDKRSIWKGMFCDKDGLKIEEFFNRYFELSPQVYSFLKLIRLIVAPVNDEKRFLERLEGAISMRIKSAPGIVGQFQDDGVRYRPRRSDEEPILVKMKLSVSVMGLEQEILV
jgi:hypothetical protein